LICIFAINSNQIGGVAEQPSVLSSFLRKPAMISKNDAVDVDRRSLEGVPNLAFSSEAGLLKKNQPVAVLYSN